MECARKLDQWIVEQKEKGKKNLSTMEKREGDKGDVLATLLCCCILSLLPVVNSVHSPCFYTPVPSSFIELVFEVVVITGSVKNSSYMC